MSMRPSRTVGRYGGFGALYCVMRFLCIDREWCAALNKLGSASLNRIFGRVLSSDHADLGPGPPLQLQYVEIYIRIETVTDVEAQL